MKINIDMRKEKPAIKEALRQYLECHATINRMIAKRENSASLTPLCNALYQHLATYDRMGLLGRDEHGNWCEKP